MPCVNEPATPTRQELLGKVFMDLRPNAVVQIEKVEKWFGRTVALEGITLTVRSGDFMVLLGRNGAGKSTLLRVMARMAKPNSGKVEVCGFDIRHDSEAVRQRLGFVAHSSYLYRHLTARENLRFFARLSPLLGRFRTKRRSPSVGFLPWHATKACHCPCDIAPPGNSVAGRTVFWARSRGC
ncbi:MAG: hypothetical protein DMG05_06845 [Acidobacteria bacterium]|nr:MAG: hypothetical protein DMG05_06845 [Acidobacteriota bacterium]